MFPISFNFPFRKKDGSLSTIGDEITNGGGGSGYTLPTASAEVKGGIKVGSGLTMSGETLNNSNPTPYALPTASAEVKGGIKVGSGLSIDENGVLSASGGSSGGTTIKTLEATVTAVVSTADTKSFKSFQIQTSTLNGKTLLGVSAEASSSNYKALAISPVTTEYFSVLAYNDTNSSQSISKVYVYYID